MSNHKREAALGDETDLVVTEAMRRAVRREECQLGGHAFDVLVTFMGDPKAVICGRCGISWDVNRESRRL